LKEEQDTHRREKNQLEDTLMRDKYSTDFFSMENSKLKQAKGEFEQEREQLIHKISNAEAETSRCHLENKELKRKLKKLEKIVYGKK
jgi:chromosome segregation ATPase